MISILLADDHDLMRQGIRTLLEMQPNFEICAEARDGVEAVEKAIENRPDVVVLDVSMPKMNGLDAARQIRAQLPDTRILIFTVHDTNEMVREMLVAGAHGYILKSDASTHLAAAIEAVSQSDLYFSSGISNVVMDSMMNSGDWKGDEMSDPPLTAREIDIVKLLAQGKSNKIVAAELSISEGTVKIHVNNILSKLGVSDRTHAATFALQRGIIHLD